MNADLVGVALGDVAVVLSCKGLGAALRWDLIRHDHVSCTAAGRREERDAQHTGSYLIPA
jgi:hypothetical protein